MALNLALAEEALRALGDVLEDRGRHYDVVIAGGSALLLLRLGIRPTNDVDVVAIAQGSSFRSADPLPSPLRTAAEDVARLFGLNPGWLNAGPTALLDLGLPPGFEGRLETRTYGGLTVRSMGRRDLIFLKLYATADQGVDSKHGADLVRLDPSRDELVDAAQWARTHDPSVGFRGLLVGALQALGVDDANDQI